MTNIFERINESIMNGAKSNKTTDEAVRKLDEAQIRLQKAQAEFNETYAETFKKLVGEDLIEDLTGKHLKVYENESADPVFMKVTDVTYRADYADVMGYVVALTEDSAILDWSGNYLVSLDYDPDMAGAEAVSEDEWKAAVREAVTRIEKMNDL